MPDARRRANLQAEGPGGETRQGRCGSSGGAGKGGAGSEAGGGGNDDDRREEGLDEPSRGCAGGVIQGNVEGSGEDLMGQILHYFLMGDESDLAPDPCG